VSWGVCRQKTNDGEDVKDEELCPAARIESGEHFCQLHLRQITDLPGNLWSWNVYIDGNIEHRAPGYTRKHPEPCYAVLFKGEHRIVLREPEQNKLERIESNTLYFSVIEQSKIVVNVLYRNERPYLEFAYN
jgi:hypothetical protein